MDRARHTAPRDRGPAGWSAPIGEFTRLGVLPVVPVVPIVPVVPGVPGVPGVPALTLLVISL